MHLKIYLISVRYRLLIIEQLCRKMTQLETSISLSCAAEVYYRYALIDIFQINV